MTSPRIGMGIQIPVTMATMPRTSEVTAMPVVGGLTTC